MTNETAPDLLFVDLDNSKGPMTAYLHVGSWPGVRKPYVPADALEAAQARIAELERENAKYAEHLLCLGVPKFGPASGPSGLNDAGFRLIGSDAAVTHFRNMFEEMRRAHANQDSHGTDQQHES